MLEAAQSIKSLCFKVSHFIFIALPKNFGTIFAIHHNILISQKYVTPCMYLYTKLYKLQLIFIAHLRTLKKINMKYMYWNTNLKTFSLFQAGLSHFMLLRYLLSTLLRMDQPTQAENILPASRALRATNKHNHKMG